MQSVSTPNGLTAHMFGPLEGRRHDAFMLSESGLPNKLRSFNGPCGDPYVLYGDPAYGVSRNNLSPFRSQNLTPAQQEFNKNMSAVRVTVEWAFGKILQYFPYLDIKKDQKVLQPNGKYYLVGNLLTNFHTCLYGSPTGTFFIWIHQVWKRTLAIVDNDCVECMSFSVLFHAVLFMFACNYFL